MIFKFFKLNNLKVIYDLYSKYLISNFIQNNFLYGYKGCMTYVYISMYTPSVSYIVLFVAHKNFPKRLLS